MDVTNRFVLDYARRHAAGGPVLDFGCGAGRVVAAGRAAGLEIHGTDVYYSGADDRREAEAAGLLGTFIREGDGVSIPFPDNHFQLVVNNQVLEHVKDLDATLGEIHRVLRPGGSVLSLFPARDVWREGHIGIPFAHWFAAGSRARFLYTWALRSLGLGTWKEQAPNCRQWARDKLEWIDKYTYYRSRSAIFDAFGRYFRSELHEIDYIRYRLRDRAGRAPLARWLDLPPAPAAASALFRRLAFLVIVSRKEPV